MAPAYQDTSFQDKKVRDFVAEHAGDFLSVLQTRAWNTREIIGSPLGKVHFTECEREVEEPQQIARIRKLIYRGALYALRLRLIENDPKSTFTVEEGEDRRFPILIQNAVDGSRSNILFDGLTVVMTEELSRHALDGSRTIHLAPFRYSEWLACILSRDYELAHNSLGITLPNAGFGVSVLPETTDGHILLTQRDSNTLVYPGRLYSPGGGPKPGQSPELYILKALQGELGLTEGHDFDIRRCRALALVSDLRHGGSRHERPELVAHLPLKITLAEVHEIKATRPAAPDRNIDSGWKLAAIKSDTGSIASHLLDDSSEFCPPTHAALAHYLLQKYITQERMSAAAIFQSLRSTLSHS